MALYIKNTVAAFLLVLFLTPVMAKFADGVFHHHDTFHCTAHCEKHFHGYHEKCPILNHELSRASQDLIHFHLSVNSFVHAVIPIMTIDPDYCGLKYSFYLRAPPYPYSNNSPVIPIAV